MKLVDRIIPALIALFFVQAALCPASCLAGRLDPISSVATRDSSPPAGSHCQGEAPASGESKPPVSESAPDGCDSSCGGCDSLVVEQAGSPGAPGAAALPVHWLVRDLPLVRLSWTDRHGSDPPRVDLFLRHRALLL